MNLFDRAVLVLFAMQIDAVWVSDAGILILL